MVDVLLLFGKLLFLALLYLFLFAVVRAGLRSVRAGVPDREPGALALVVAAGPKELMRVRIALDRPVVIGRSPEADLVIADSFVSSRHARITPQAGGPVIEDLRSTNGTVLNGEPITKLTTLHDGDVLQLGDVRLEVVSS